MTHIKRFVLTTLLGITPLVESEVILDGTLGRAGLLPGPEIEIESRFGQQVGHNLFHSFEIFNINSDERVTFTGPEDITRIISRVTGGQASHIDGVLASAIPNADIYFMNPAGIVFGPEAELDIPASLYISTAQYLKLGDTGRFDAATPEHSLLTVTPPSAFGFLDTAPASIQITGSRLFLLNIDTEARILAGEDVPLQTLSLVGGDITLTDSSLITLGHTLQLTSVSASGEVPIDVANWSDEQVAGGILNVIDTTSHPPINESGLAYGNLDASGRWGGSIAIRAGQLVMNNGWIFSDTWGDKAGRGIDIRTSTLTLQQGSRITTEAYAPGYFDNETGGSGSIAITASDLSLTGGSQINSSTRTSGYAGNITLSARNKISIAGSITLSARDGSDKSESYPSGILSNTTSQGHGGDVIVSAQELAMDDGAAISANTNNTDTRSSGGGDGSNISIKVNRLTLRGGAQIAVSAGSMKKGDQSTGKAGTLTVIAKEQTLIEGSSENQGITGLISNVSNQGQGGKISVTAPAVTIKHKGGIQAATLSDANAGSIELHVGTLDLNELGYIATTAVNGKGHAGDIRVIAQGDIMIRGAQIRLDTQSEGQGGNGYIQGQCLKLAEGGLIRADSRGTGRAGQISIDLQDKLVARDSAIKTSTQRADGGSIDMTVPNYLYLVNSNVTTSVKTDKGDGGNITLHPEFIILDNSTIIAQADEGHGGKIQINTTGIYNFSGEKVEEVINASSKRGIDGVVTVSSPETNVFESLVLLPSGFFDASHLLKNTCRAFSLDELKAADYFVVVPYSGSTPVPEDWQASRLPLPTAKP